MPELLPCYWADCPHSGKSQSQTLRGAAVVAAGVFNKNLLSGCPKSSDTVATLVEAAGLEKAMPERLQKCSRETEPQRFGERAIYH